MGLFSTDDDDDLDATMGPNPSTLNMPPIDKMGPGAPSAPDTPDISATPAPLDPRVTDHLMNLKQQRDALVNQGSQDGASNGILAALSAIGAGFQGKDAGAAATGALDRQAKAREQRLSDFDKSVAANEAIDKNDPTSRKSQMIQGMVKRLYPGKFTDDQISQLAAGDQDLVLKPLELKAKLDQAAASQQMAHEDRQLKNEFLKNNMNEKSKDKVDKLVKSMRDDFDANKGRAGNFGKVSEKVLQAERLEGLVNSYENGDLPPAQMEELSLGLVNMLNNGNVAGREQVKALVPHTFWGSAQDAGQWLLNEPRGAGQQKFVHKMMDTIQREKSIANNQLNSMRVQRLAAHNRLKELSPDDYNGVLQHYNIDPDSIKNGKYVPPQSGPPPETRRGKDGKTYKKVPGGWEEMGDDEINSLAGQ